MNAPRDGGTKLDSAEMRSGAAGVSDLGATWDASEAAADAGITNAAPSGNAGTSSAPGVSGAAAGSSGSASPPAVCPDDACRPGGACAVQNGDYVCTCDADFAGSGTKSCTVIDDCPPGACVPGGSCIDGVKDYSCRCDAEYMGAGTKSCKPIDDCPRDACTPGGRCVDGNSDYTCSCDSGYSGTGAKACVNIDDCPVNACGPYGTCEDGVNTYTCKCDGPGGPPPNTCPYHDLGDGTVYDSMTGLTWAKMASVSVAQPGSATVEQMQRQCAGLSLSGGGWRVPTERELLTTKTIFPDSPGCLACIVLDEGVEDITFVCGIWQGTIFYVRCVR